MAFFQLHEPPLFALLLLLCCCLRPPAAMAGAGDSCFPPDLQALRAFAPHIVQASEGYDKESWGLEELWGPNDDCCSWKGINCSINGTPSAGGQPRVSSLVLHIQSFSILSLTSNFLQPLCNISLLSTLDLLYDPSDLTMPSFSVHIPACLGHLSALRYLSLLEMHFEGPFPSSFSHLLHLQHLEIGEVIGKLSGESRRLLSGSVLPISNLPNLTLVRLSGLGLSGPLPPFQAPFLETLDLSLNSYNSTLLEFTSLSRLPSLTCLDLSDNAISGSIPPSISRLSNLSTLLLSSNSLSGEIPTSFCKLARLVMLNLRGQSKGRFNASLDSLECDFINLTYLFVADNQLMGPFPRWIGRSPSLWTLDLSNNLFRGPLPEEWRNLRNLVKLDLSGNSILPPQSDDARLPDWLFYNPLETFTLVSCGLQTRDLSCSGKLALLNGSLNMLTLSDNNLTGGETLECIALHNFSRLPFVDLSKNPLSIVLSDTLFPQPSASLGGLYLSSCNLKGVEINSPVPFYGFGVDLSHNGLALDLATLLVGLG